MYISYCMIVWYVDIYVCTTPQFLGGIWHHVWSKRSQNAQFVGSTFNLIFTWKILWNWHFMTLLHDSLSLSLSPAPSIHVPAWFWPVIVLLKIMMWRFAENLIPKNEAAKIKYSILLIPASEHLRWRFQQDSEDEVALLLPVNGLVCLSGQTSFSWYLPNVCPSKRNVKKYMVPLQKRS